MNYNTSFIHYIEISIILAPSKSLLLWWFLICIISPERRIKANRISIWSTLVIVNSIIVRSALSPYRQRDSFTVEPIFLKWLNLITFLIIQIREAVFKFNCRICTIFLLSKLKFQATVRKTLTWYFTYLIAIIYLHGILRKNLKICKISIK